MERSKAIGSKNVQIPGAQVQYYEMVQPVHTEQQRVIMGVCENQQTGVSKV